MFNNLKSKKINTDPIIEEHNKICEEIAFLKEQLSHTYTLFNLTDDNDLAESYIYQINSLNIRYSYLIKKAKEMGAKSHYHLLH